MTDDLAARGVRLVTVMLDGTPQAARFLSNRIGLTVPVVLGDGALMKRYRVSAYPWTVIIDRDGKARFAIRGAQDEAGFRKTFERYL